MFAGAFSAEAAADEELADGDSHRDALIIRGSDRDQSHRVGTVDSSCPTKEARGGRDQIGSSTSNINPSTDLRSGIFHFPSSRSSRSQAIVSQSQSLIVRLPPVHSRVPLEGTASLPRIDSSHIVRADSERLFVEDI